MSNNTQTEKVMEQLRIQGKLEHLNALHAEVYEMANSFAGDVTGPIACLLHQAANNIGSSMRIISGHYELQMPGLYVPETNRAEG